ncbi:hypothetical protein [Hydrogenophaga sp. OTU3427]|uniref:hypothetical protein n=1 Tax=Hydrogenophaga sp. OTU3427 TaxID=3043856 RepID=UPI00313ACA60
MRTLSMADPSAIAAEGERIYRERFQQEYETKFAEQFAAIDVRSGRAFVAPYAEDAIDKALDSCSTALLHLVRVGAASAYCVAFFVPSEDADLARPR